MFISKKMRVINTRDSPRISLKRSPLHSVSKNMLSDFFKLNFISNKPIIKFITERSAPSKIDLKIKPVIPDKRKIIETMRSARKEIMMQTISSCFSFFIISGFQNRFDKCVHTSKYTEKGEYYSQNRLGFKLTV